MDYSKVILQNKQYNQICKEFKLGKAGHAYLLTTADADYSKQICFSVAKNIVGSGSVNHPDIFIFGDSGKIDTSDINKITDELFVAPYQSNKKVYIILQMQNMNETAQNKLLKSLEEPPKDVVFLMTADSTNSLLSTVVSRSKNFVVDLLTTKQIIELLGESSPQTNAAACSCGGNSTLAQKLTSDSYLQLYNLVLEILQKVNSSKDILQFAAKLDPKKADTSEVIKLCILFLRDICMIASGNQALVTNTFVLDKLTQISDGFTFDCASKLIDLCLQLDNQLYYNTNNTAVIDQLLLAIAREKVLCKK